MSAIKRRRRRVDLSDDLEHPFERDEPVDVYEFITGEPPERDDEDDVPIMDRGRR